MSGGLESYAEYAEDCRHRLIRDGAQPQQWPDKEMYTWSCTSLILGGTKRAKKWCLTYFKGSHVVHLYVTWSCNPTKK